LNNDNFNSNHTYSLSGLIKNTLYHLKLKNADQNGNQVVLEDISFTTTDSGDYIAPTISSILVSPIFDTTAIINWETNELTTSIVNYGTATGTYTLLSTDTNLNKSHAITLNTLASSTKYYFNIISKDASLNTATSTEESFTTLEKLTDETTVQAREEAARAEGVTSGRSNASGGGGMLIIDKTDKIPPVISEIKISDISSNSAIVSWTTNENSDSYVEFGLSTDYKQTDGSRARVTNHKVSLDGLLPDNTYHYKLSSVDADGNMSESMDATFTTISMEQELQKAAAPSADTTIADSEQDSARKLFNLASQAIQKAVGIIKESTSKLSLNFVESSLANQQISIEELAYLLPTPVMSADPYVETTDKTATIKWITDKEAGSQVAIASEKEYKRNPDKPYSQTVGNSNERTINHLVMISDLEPNTVYHYQLRSKPVVGSEAKSRDFTFKTKAESLGIQSYVVQNISDDEAKFKWVTNTETDSTIRYTAYRNGVLDLESAQTKTDKDLTTIHEIGLSNLEAGITYKVELISEDSAKNTVSEVIPSFLTSKNDLAPAIDQVQTISAISPGKNLKIQTVISWLTNEPATTKVYYQRGVARSGEKLKEETKIDESYTKKHVVVITKFDPGTVYSFQTESIDSSGNITLSKVYTILTPRQEESVFQVIIKNLEGVFGWVNQIK